MSFTIKIQRNNSDGIALTKDITDLLTLTGTLKQDTSIIDPIILFDGDISDVTGANYMTIDSFSRSYFITDVISVTGNLFEVHAHVDVLSSFASEIRANKGIVARQENDWNLYINDGVFKVYQNPIITTEPFPNGFTDYEYVLIASGAGGDKAYSTPEAPAPTPGTAVSFTPYTDLRANRDESCGECTQYVVNRTQEAIGVRCVLHYNDAYKWMESSTVENTGWTKIPKTNFTENDILAGDVLIYDDAGNTGGHCLFVEAEELSTNSRIIISQSNVRYPGGRYGSDWTYLISNRHYRYSCTNIAIGDIATYLGNNLIGLMRYTG